MNNKWSLYEPISKEKLLRCLHIELEELRAQTDAYAIGVDIERRLRMLTQRLNAIQIEIAARKDWEKEHEA